MAINAKLLEALHIGARFPELLSTRIFSAVMARTYAPERSPAIAGLTPEQHQRLLHHHFPYLDPGVFPPFATGEVLPAAHDEFAETLALLLENRNEDTLDNTWLAHAVATASLSPVPLWQALDLPGKAGLSGLMQRHFFTLYRRNKDGLPWKRLFYREMARAAGVGVCSRERCADCPHVERCRSMDAPPERPLAA
jgi:nitrogen fixation protein NifQ